MFVEQKDSGLFLAKKSYQKKFLVKINKNIITDEIIDALTKKELVFIFDSKIYQIFESKIYNKSMLKKIVSFSKRIYNYVEDIKGTSRYIKCDSEYLEAMHIFERWLAKDFPRKFIYNSNNIEGSKIPEAEIEKLMASKKTRYKVKNEIQEVINSIQSWKFLNNIFIFNEANIKKLYHILTKNLLQENGEKYPRGFKKISNVVNNNTTTAPEKVSDEIRELIHWYKDNKRKIFPLQLAFDFHLRYEQIHPFENGNGRTGRFLMNKILIQNGMLPMIVFKENKTSYSNAISSCNSGSKKKYYKFMLEQYKKTLDVMENETTLKK